MALTLKLVFVFFAAIFIVKTSCAFTPDAAYKRKTAGLTTNPSIGESRRIPTNSGQQEAAFANGRKMRLSLLNQENIRKSITVPPSYEDYMEVRGRSLRNLLGRKG